MPQNATNLTHNLQEKSNEAFVNFGFPCDIRNTITQSEPTIVSSIIVNINVMMQYKPINKEQFVLDTKQKAA
jgi:hypothetical protein